MNFKHRIKSLERKTQIGKEYKPAVLFEDDFPNPDELQEKSEELNKKGFMVYIVKFLDALKRVNIKRKEAR
ncbi:MAG: hypothetical protein BWY41_00039 [Candidatus Atribacteria bacterium ADurb.Bin276]|uniref:Uncharacterized protein n=1 Tax=Candidatus Atribacter allofermentans TaxID=1852833 RepID=A0A1V5T4F8_9BACT|nr:MAG: hypothetical protein BWY41_00039 [Candidatus Atribacteria bacterium ADurb.Bin276]